MLLDVLRDLRKAVRGLSFGPPVAHVYRPLDYAWPMVEAYVARFGDAPKEALFLGMNPGPFGMGQTGIPFGDVVSVREWMKLDEKIVAPKDMHPKRPVVGLACTGVEVSGRRLWGAIAERHPAPETFFARAMVLNYCPLLFLDEGGANVTPDKLRKEERKACEAVCDRALARAIEALSPRHLLGVGVYATARLEAAAPDRAVLCTAHPSPASPPAHPGWAGLVRRTPDDAGIPGLL